MPKTTTEMTLPSNMDTDTLARCVLPAHTRPSTQAICPSALFNVIVVIITKYIHDYPASSQPTWALHTNTPPLNLWWLYVTNMWPIQRFKHYGGKYRPCDLTLYMVVVVGVTSTNISVFRFCRKEYTFRLMVAELPCTEQFAFISVYYWHILQEKAIAGKMRYDI